MGTSILNMNFTYKNLYLLLFMFLTFFMTACSNSSIDSTDSSIYPIEPMTGSIKGTIVIDGFGAEGFTVSVFGTSFTAVTCEDGIFWIRDISEGNYHLVVIRGNFTHLFNETVDVIGGKNTELETKDLTKFFNVFVPVESLSIKDTFSLSAGQTETLIATVYPLNATIKSVLWSSDNPSVASVDRLTGKITTHTAGEVTITAQSINRNITANSKLKVRAGLPSLYLSIAPAERGGTDVLHRDIWRPTTVSLHGAGDYAMFAFERARAEARGRGNSSWGMSYKRPLRIRFNTARSIFGSSYSARDWTLIANALDHSMMRNYSAYFLGSLLGGLDFSPTGHFIHLYMDDEYRGVYMLSDQIHVHTGRVELTSNLNPALSEYFLEANARALEQGLPYFDQGLRFAIEFPGNGILNQNLGHSDFVKNFMGKVYEVMQGGNINEISQVVDIQSFIDYYLVQEFFKNQDVWGLSLFYQVRQTETGIKLFAGPLWDFDLSSGSAAYTYDTTPQGVYAANANLFFKLLMNTNWFREQACLRWNEIKNNQIQIMTERIKYLSDVYQLCFEYNFERWSDRNIWVTAPELISLSFMEQVDFLTNWFEKRKIWMDEFFQ